MKGGFCCFGFGSNEAASQFTRLMWRKHRFRSFLTLYAFALSVKHLSLRTLMAIVSVVKIPDGIHHTQFGDMRSQIT
jgi:hypothetical protein